jgi:hypothetical protein
MANQWTLVGSLDAGVPPAPSAPRRRTRGYWLVVLALLGSGALWYFGALQGRLAPASPASNGLALAFQRVGSDYCVNWNRNSPIIAGATYGTLLVKDGAFEKTLDLDQQQLHTGQLFYSPATGDVVLRLEVFGPSPEPVVESIRWLGGYHPQGEMQAADEAAPAPPAPKKEAAKPTAAAVTHPVVTDPGERVASAPAATPATGGNPAN